MSFRIEFKAVAAKDIKKLSPLLQKRVAKKLQYFLAQPDPLAYAEVLKKPPRGGSYRFRVGNYRVVFDVEGKTLTILYVEHRSEVYRKR